METSENQQHSIDEKQEKMVISGSDSENDKDFKMDQNSDSSNGRKYSKVCKSIQKI